METPLALNIVRFESKFMVVRWDLEKNSFESKSRSLFSESLILMVSLDGPSRSVKSSGKIAHMTVIWHYKCLTRVR
jgi:hypothetical protein